MRSPIALTVLVALAAAGAVGAAPATDLDRQRNLEWFDDARFGMFVHWGIYSVIGMEASWPLYGKQFTREEYEGQARQFNPADFRADELVGLAKRAGMKYLVITTKHHDGFCMYDSKLTDYTIMNGPCKRDLIGEVADACHRHGLRLGFYYSLCDWHDPRYLSMPVQGGPFPLGDIRRDAHTWREFTRFVHGQVRELLTNYGRVDIMWFDGGWEHTPEEWRSEELHQMIRTLQPHILINNRLPGEGIADYVTPEQMIPSSAPSGPWETCMTINNTWGYNPRDREFKPAELLIRNLVQTASGGGNYLLNVGPGPDGSIQPEFRERLLAVGDWLRDHGEAIYGTQRGPRRLSDQATATTKRNALYLHMADPPKDYLVLDRLASPVLGAWMVPSRKPVRVQRLGRGARLVLDPTQFDPVSTVIELRFQCPLVVDSGIRPEADGSYVLRASDAECHGTQLTYQAQYDDLGCWLPQEDWCEWTVAIDAPGRYRVVAECGVPPGQEGSQMVLSVGGEALGFVTVATAGWTDYQPRDLGTVDLPRGPATVSLQCTKKAAFAVLNLRAIRLTPAAR
ncbi:MAG TPA: alpha-L-fucosidase [Armatimonadota bacterium]|nr:alpha-L-fucosidase [Armatimonadota bacterium]